jgi:4-hydroxymandelate oxidase
MSETIDAINLSELEALARSVLPASAYHYYATGANDEITLRENRIAFERIAVHPRMLVDVSLRDMRTTVLGEQVSMPILVAPMAFQAVAHSGGEIATTKAAGAAETLMILSTLATTSIEEALEVASGPVWFQLYVFKDREITASLVQRAEAAGCKAIVMTVDVPLLGKRERDIRSRFTLPEHLTAKNLWPQGLQGLGESVSSSGINPYVASLFDPSLTWKDVEWLCGLTKLPVLVKGILRTDDARRALNHGVSGLVVSNHGARQLDTAPSTISVLPEIIDAVAGAVEIFMDGGVRRGTDVLKALAYGARAVLVGRPILWGLALKGETGVRFVLEMLRQEFDLAMGLAGCPRLADISRDLLRPLGCGR